MRLSALLQPPLACTKGAEPRGSGVDGSENMRTGLAVLYGTVIADSLRTFSTLLIHTPRLQAGATTTATQSDITGVRLRNNL